MKSPSVLERLTLHVCRPGRNAAGDIKLDIYWLLGLGVLLMGVGLGLRDPWPADEPRFALVARDMVRSGNWLIPMIGGDTYADKPPLFFWLMASCYKLLGSLRMAFLLPSLLASLGTVVLVYDLGRRLWNRTTGLAAGLLLLVTIQFVWQGRQAQIDATVCFWIALGLYGLLRHLLLGPSWRWYVIGWAAAGLGIITKGVGFLPLLVLIPYFALRNEQWTPRPQINGGWRWALGPLALILAIGVWLVPMLLAALHDPQLAAYRDEILFHQTVTRYANAWHHQAPMWFFITEVIPPLWLPGIAFVPWLVRPWREAWRAYDLRLALLLSWTVLVVLFFSLSTGKRGVYVLPAVPAFCLTVAPYLQDLLRRVGVRRVLLGLALLVSVICVGAGLYALLNSGLRSQVSTRYGIDPPAPLLLIGVLGLRLCWWTRLRYAGMAWLGVVAIALTVVGIWINPAMNAVRSSERFTKAVTAGAQDIGELGLVGYSEQYLLEFTRPTTNFGHARWREWQHEADDAAAWLAAAPNRGLLLQEAAWQRCFAQTTATLINDADERWFLVRGSPDAACVQRGNLQAAKHYQP